MTMLAYCITDASAAIELPAAGIAGKIVDSIEHGGLRCFVSRIPAGTSISGKESAVAFHRVLQEIFQQTVIIPFRFPTTLEDEPELISFLDQHALEYQQSLRRLRDMVQMEIRITWKAADAEATSTTLPQTGTAYLRAKQERERKLRAICADLQSRVQSWVSDWREHPSAHGLRIFALIARASIAEFQQALANRKMDAELSARASGPWPPTEFLERYDGEP